MTDGRWSLLLGCIGSGAIRLRATALGSRRCGLDVALSRCGAETSSPAPATRRCCACGWSRSASLFWARCPVRDRSRCRKRHLGLVQAEEQPELMKLLDAAGDFIPKHIDLDLIVSVAEGRQYSDGARVLPPPPVNGSPCQGCRVLVYLSGIFWIHWKAARARRFCRSRVADEAALMDSADNCWLPGGYLNCYAVVLALPRSSATACNSFAHDASRAWECGGDIWRWRAGIGRQRRACGIKWQGFWAWKQLLKNARCMG